MNRQSVAAQYHQQTKYHPATIGQGHYIDAEHPPAQFKDYAGAERIELRPYLPTGEGETWQAEAALRDPNGTFGLPALSRLLFATNGVTALGIAGEDRHYFRAAPSAGALYPTDLYLLVRDHADIPDGVYYFHVRDHALVEVYPKGLAPSGNQMFERLARACFNDTAVAQSDVALIATAVYWRSAWKYGERAYRRCLLDTGHVIGNFAIVAPRMGMGWTAVGGFVDDEVASLLAIPTDKEGVLGVFSMHELPRMDELRAGPTARPGAPDETRDDRDAILGIHNAGAIVRANAPKTGGSGGNASEPYLVNPKYEFAPGTKLKVNQADINDQIELAILRRRSTRALTGAPLALGELSDVLAYAYRPDLTMAAELHPRNFDTGMLETFVVVHAVDGLSPGVYYFAPGFMELLKVREGNVKNAVFHLSLGQELARDAGAVVIHTADLEAATERYGSRAYRYLHMDAGHLGERINVAAIKLNLGVSGIGGFFDDEVNELLDIPENELCVYITCLGRPPS